MQRCHQAWVTCQYERFNSIRRIEDVDEAFGNLHFYLGKEVEKKEQLEGKVRKGLRETLFAQFSEQYDQEMQSKMKVEKAI